MQTLNRILVPFDFSEVARRAFDYAQSIAEPLGATIVVLHVHEADYDDPLEQHCDQAAEALEATLREQRAPDVDLKIVLRLGEAAPTINRVAEEESADALMLGTRGRKGFSRMLHGSVAEAALRATTRPAFMIHADGEEAPHAYAGLPKRIVVATDFGRPATHAIDYAIELAKQSGGRVTLVHAYSIPVMTSPDGVLATAPTDETIRVVRRSLEASVAARASSGVQIDAALVEGPPAEAIAGYASSIDADLIVVGTQGRRGLERVLLGSVAESVVRDATRPVLVMH